MQRSADNVSWSGLSLYDGKNERLMFGVPFALNPTRSRRELGIHNLGANQRNDTGLEPVAGTKYVIITKVDYTTIMGKPEPRQQRTRDTECRHGLHECSLRHPLRLRWRFADVLGQTWRVCAGHGDLHLHLRAAHRE